MLRNAIPSKIALSMNPDVNLGMMPLPAKTADDDVTLISGENVALGISKDSKVKDAAIELLNYLAQPDVAKAIPEATGNKPALTNVKVDLGMIQPEDVVIALSWSGETAELAAIVAHTRRFRVGLIGVVNHIGCSAITATAVTLK